MTPLDKLEHFDILHREDGSLWELGRGAMGVTYKAWDTRLHCAVALKVVHPSILGGGKPLFKDRKPQSLSLLSATPFPKTGAVALRYTVNR